MKSSENRVCFTNTHGTRTCKCFKNGKRVSCNKLRMVPKMDAASEHEIDFGFKLPNLFSAWPFSDKKKKASRKMRQHGGGKTRRNTGTPRSRGFFISANCNKTGKTLKCNNTLGW